MSSTQPKPVADKKKREILYLKRTPTVTYDLASGNPIPDTIKKYYIQQRLPVRKQSLAAASDQTKAELKKRTLQQQCMPSPMRNSSIPISMQTRDVATRIEPTSPTSPHYHDNSQSCPSFNVSEADAVESLAVGNAFHTLRHYAGKDDEDEDEEFNFKDRPPSTAICIRPMDPNDTDDEDENEDKDMMLDEALSGLAESWDGAGAGIDDNTRAPVSPDSGRRKSSIRDLESITPQIKVIQLSSSESLSLPTENQYQQPQPQLESRLSTETVFTDISDSTMTPNHSSMTESYSSVFLSTMQSRKEEQQKSIDAYRSQHIAIYTALLSEVAKEFHKRITCSTLVKDGIEYHEVFSGKEAVDRLSSILGNTDRSEAIEIGSALRAQNFFHDVNYEPAFIDSTDELYAFKEMPNTPKDDVSEQFSKESTSESSHLPNGIYTDLTDCYSPTCVGDSLCYSWSCLKKKSLKQSQQYQVKEENTRLWSQSIPESVVDATLPEERKRQECIYELIYTEQDFVRDLQYVHEFWVEPLLSEDIISDHKREEFVKQVFYNIADIRHVNTELSRALEVRQAEKYLVSSIGDVMLEHVQYFQPFIEYGAHQVIGKFNFELEKKRNPLFAQFVEETERKPESRRLELNGYLTKPTTRLGRYNLLLREILKITPDDNPDKEAIPQIMEIITAYLEQVNVEAGKCENFFNLQQIGERLEFKSTADYVDLKLEQPGRQLLMKGRMKRKGNSSSEASDLQVFLFDHYLVLAKIKSEDHLEKYKTYRRPIPLELLSINVTMSNRQKRASSILPYNRPINLTATNNAAPCPSTSESISSAAKTSNLSITFIHHGRKGSPAITLFTSASSLQQIWIKKIMDQKALLANTRSIFSITPLITNHFTIANRVNNTATIFDDDNMEQIIVGADQGVFVTKRVPATKKSVISRIINVEKVSQIELMPESQLLVLADKTLWTFPLDVLTPNVSPQIKRGRSVSQNTAFFHVGECLSKTLVCVVKSNTLSATTIRVLEPVITDESKKTKSLFSLKRLVRNGPAGLKAYKDLYLPSEASSINLLKSKMCISSPREIGVVDMKNFGVQALLDPEDEELSFVFNRPDVRPVTIYRIQFAEYLVCYNEFAFFVDQRGRFIRSSARIDWEGAPDSFALSYPYVLAFEPDFIEIRNVHTGELEQIIRGKNIRCTSTNTHNTVLQGAMDDIENEGYQVVFQLEKLTRKCPPSPSC
ncbi:CNH domain-containing protein [Parasitella parasitica]|nr:CNH domain-containing protein [Parasitella parasitica]